MLVNILTNVNKQHLIVKCYQCNYFCDGKAEFSAAITSVSHDPSETILILSAAQETFPTIFP